MEKCILFTLTNTCQHPNILRGSDRRTHHKTPHPLVAVHLCQDSAHLANSIPENRLPACNPQEQAQAKKCDLFQHHLFSTKTLSFSSKKRICMVLAIIPFTWTKVLQPRSHAPFSKVVIFNQASLLSLTWQKQSRLQ